MVRGHGNKSRRPSSPTLRPTPILVPSNIHKAESFSLARGRDGRLQLGALEPGT